MHLFRELLARAGLNFLVFPARTSLAAWWEGAKSGITRFVWPHFSNNLINGLCDHTGRYVSFSQRFGTPRHLALYLSMRSILCVENEMKTRMRFIFPFFFSFQDWPYNSKANIIHHHPLLPSFFFKAYSKGENRVITTNWGCRIPGVQ